MITYSKIGHFGRLGNQMFQFAGTYGIAKKLGYNVSFPIENIDEIKIEHFLDGVNRECIFDIPKVFKLNNKILKPKEEILSQVQYTIPEPHFHYSEEYLNIPDGCDLQGYFQSEKYFKHVEEEIRELFIFKDEIKETANKLFPTFENETVSIHLRRGDYINQQQFHPVCPPEYYVNALQNFTNKNYHFIIFSDDIEYCKELFEDQENIHYINNKDPYIDMCLMSMCDHNIIANSSFSWWGAYLNKNENKQVIAPKQWFGPFYQNTKTDDLYCNNWIKI